MQIQDRKGGEGQAAALACSPVQQAIPAEHAEQHHGGSPAHHSHMAAKEWWQSVLLQALLLEVAAESGRTCVPQCVGICKTSHSGIPPCLLYMTCSTWYTHLRGGVVSFCTLRAAARCSFQGYNRLFVYREVSFSWSSQRQPGGCGCS